MDHHHLRRGARERPIRGIVRRRVRIVVGWIIRPRVGVGRIVAPGIVGRGRRTQGRVAGRRARSGID